MTLVEERPPALGSGMTLVDEGRSLDEYYVTGAVVAGSRLYAVSAAFSTLLVFDLARGELTGAHGLDGPERPTGVALRGSDLYVVNSDGDVGVVSKPSP